MVRSRSTFEDASTGLGLSAVASLHNLVTVVDAASIFEQLATVDTLVDRGWQSGEGWVVNLFSASDESDVLHGGDCIRLFHREFEGYVPASPTSNPPTREATGRPQTHVSPAWPPHFTHRRP